MSQIIEKNSKFPLKFSPSGSPRAFVKYNYDPDVVPYPEPFVKGVENSFGNPRIRKKFYKKYYQLLMHGQFPHKETKLCLVGPADSGKTSWFGCFQGIIPSKYIAGVMNDGRFSAALINNNTQIVMMDEWTPDSLSCEDAKRVLQGECFDSLCSFFVVLTKTLTNCF